MLIDFHCHTKDSFDAFTSYEELLQVCINKNISASAITEHDLPSKVPDNKFRENNISLIHGCEFTTDTGAHIIGLFIREALPKKNNVQSIIDYIISQNGIIYIPHPFKDKTGFCKMHSDYERYLKHCNIIEIANGGIKESKEDINKIKEISKKYGLILVSGSDSHKSEQIGYYVNYYETEDTDLHYIVKNLSPKLYYDSNYHQPPRRLNFLQKKAIYQYLVLKISPKFKRFLKKFAYTILKKNRANYISNYVELNL